MQVYSQTLSLRQPHPLHQWAPPLWWQQTLALESCFTFGSDSAPQVRYNAWSYVCKQRRIRQHTCNLARLNDKLSFTQATTPTHQWAPPLTLASGCLEDGRRTWQLQTESGLIVPSLCQKGNWLHHYSVGGSTSCPAPHFPANTQYHLRQLFLRMRRWMWAVDFFCTSVGQSSRSPPRDYVTMFA